MSILQMTVDPAHKVAGEAHVIELVLLVQGIHAGLPTNHLADDVAILVEHTPRELLQKP
jgi:hypothetical protein